MPIEMTIPVNTNDTIIYKHLEKIYQFYKERSIAEEVALRAMADCLETCRNQGFNLSEKEILKKAVENKHNIIVKLFASEYQKSSVDIPQPKSSINSKTEIPPKTISSTQPDVQTQRLLDKIKKENTPLLDENTLKILQNTVSEVPKKVFSEIKKIENIEIPGPNGPIKSRIYFPKVDQKLPVFIFFHGGGWALGSLDEYDFFCQEICRQTPCLVFSVDYHLAPQYKFPKPLQDCYAATEWISKNISQYGGDSKRIAIGGDSAGGNLAAAVTLVARELKSPQIYYQVLIYPVTDHQFDTQSYKEFGNNYYLTKHTMEFLWKTYLNKPEDGMSPYASPLKASTLANLPPALMVAANFDPLLDEDIAYASRLQNDSVPVELKRYNSIHGFINFENDLDVAHEAIKDIAEALKKTFNPQNSI